MNGYDYYDKSPSSNEVAYGHRAGNRELSFEDCEDYMHSKMSEVGEICGLRHGGQVH